MHPSTFLFGFIPLALSIVDASPSHIAMAGVPLAGVPHPTCIRSLYNSELLKRDDAFYVEKQGHYYMAYIITGSGSACNSYTWVGARDSNPYVQGDDSVETAQIYSAKYGGGLIEVTARTWHDRIILDDLVIDPQQIGVAVEVSGFPADFDGILGLGPSGLSTELTLDHATVPTVVDNLYSQGTISHPVLGVYFVPINAGNMGGAGLLAFGSIDGIGGISLTSSMKYVPLTQKSTVNRFWGVDASFVYGNMPISGPTSGILDTGAEHIFLSNAYQGATGASVNSLDDSTWLSITQDQYNNLQTLSILIGDQSYDLSPNAQIFARSSPNDEIILVVHVNIIGIDPRIEFLLGCPFFQRYYVVFNSSSSQIGFASHMFTYSTTN
ncbi:hypothetical protein ID866_8813 [Astraeus odoratus]|nr:hypothetical protein ID866_8813 [Astraeus odoratus]